MDDGFAPSDDEPLGPVDDGMAFSDDDHSPKPSKASKRPKVSVAQGGDSSDSGFEEEPVSPIPSKKWDDDVKKMDKALSTFHGQQVEFVYEAVDPVDGSFYVGRTNNLQRRGKEHDRTYIKKLREYLRLKNYTFKQIMKPVYELPNGCDPGDAKEMETFFIFIRKTVYDPETNPFGCNSKIGDGGTNMTQKRFRELKHMFSKDGPGYSFPARTHQEEALARMYAQIAEDHMKLAKEVGDEEAVEVFNECKTLATNELDKHMSKRMGLRKYVEHVLAEYEVAEAVDKNALQVQLNAIREKMDSEEKFQVLRRMPKAFSFTTQHPVDHECKPRTDIPEMVITPKAARGTFEVLLEFIASCEEPHLEWTNPSVKELMDCVRVAYGSREDAPRDADGPDAAQLLSKLKKWRGNNNNNNQYGGGRTDLDCCNVVMRNVPWWNQFSNRNEVHEKNLCRLFVLLRAGYGLEGEPHFEGQKGKMSCSVANKPAYDLLYNMIRGMGQRDKDRIFAVLDEKNRRPWYELRWNENVNKKRQRVHTSNVCGDAGSSDSD